MDQIIEVRLSVHFSAATTRGGSGRDDDERTIGRDDLNVSDVGDVQVPAQDEIDVHFGGALQRDLRVARHIVRAELLERSQMMVDGQNSEIAILNPSEKGAHRVALHLVNAPPLHRASEGGIDAENGESG